MPIVTFCSQARALWHDSAGQGTSASMPLCGSLAEIAAWDTPYTRIYTGSVPAYSVAMQQHQLLHGTPSIGRLCRCRAECELVLLRDNWTASRNAYAYSAAERELVLLGRA